MKPTHVIATASILLSFSLHTKAQTCPAALPSGGSTAAVTSGVTFNFNASDASVVESVVVSGQRFSFATGLVFADRVTFSYGRPDAGSQRITNGPDSANPGTPNIVSDITVATFPADIVTANRSADFDYYLMSDTTIDNGADARYLF